MCGTSGFGRPNSTVDPIRRGRSLFEQLQEGNLMALIVPM
jgi:hypothetical protein